MHTRDMNTTDAALAAFASVNDGAATSLQRYRTAAELGVSSATLRMMIDRGLVESRLAQSSIRRGERRTYRLTLKGWSQSRRLIK